MRTMRLLLLCAASVLLSSRWSASFSHAFVAADQQVAAVVDADGHQHVVGVPAADDAVHSHECDHAHDHEHAHEHAHAHDHGHDHDHTREPAQQVGGAVGTEQHEHSHEHNHEHSHSCSGHHDHDHDHDHAHDQGHSHDHAHEQGDDIRHRVLREDEKHPATAILLTFGSGMSALLGGIIVIMLGQPSNTLLGHLLSFASGIMLYISYADLLPHAIADMSDDDAAAHDHDHGHDHSHGAGGAAHAFLHGSGVWSANLWMLGGMLFFVVVAMLIPDLADDEGQGGHGHSHSHSHGAGQKAAKKGAENSAAVVQAESKTKSRDRSKAAAIESAPAAAAVATDSDAGAAKQSAKDKRRLLMTGVLAAVGISLHNLPEGLIVYNQAITGICKGPALGDSGLASLLPQSPTQCMSRGLAVILAIALHNIPEGMAVASPIYASTGSKWKAIWWTLVSAAAEPAAAVLFGLLYSSHLTRHIMSCLNAGVAGIMIALCMIELIPAACAHVSPKVRIAAADFCVIASARSSEQARLCRLSLCPRTHCLLHLVSHLLQAAALSNIAGQAVMFFSLHAMRSAGVH